MDHMKDSIWIALFAEKDPKIEYKREGFRMFNEMLEAIEDRVTDIIFKVRLEAGARARSVWNVSQTSHDEVGPVRDGRAPARRRTGPAGRGQGQADQARNAQSRPQRPLPLRQRQKIQKMPRQRRSLKSVKIAVINVFAAI